MSAPSVRLLIHVLPLYPPSFPFLSFFFFSPFFPLKKGRRRRGSFETETFGTEALGNRLPLFPPPLFPPSFLPLVQCGKKNPHAEAFSACTTMRSRSEFSPSFFYSLFSSFSQEAEKGTRQCLPLSCGHLFSPTFSPFPFSFFRRNRLDFLIPFPPPPLSPPFPLPPNLDEGKRHRGIVILFALPLFPFLLLFFFKKEGFTRRRVWKQLVPCQGVFVFFSFYLSFPYSFPLFPPFFFSPSFFLRKRYLF